LVDEMLSQALKELDEARAECRKDLPYARKEPGGALARAFRDDRRRIAELAITVKALSKHLYELQDKQ
jgi:hypothetical protein